MKKFPFFFPTCLVLISIILSGCSSRATTTKQLPGIDIASNKVNTHFVIFEDPVDRSEDSHRNNEILTVTVKNLTDKTIIFLPGYIHIFSKSDDTWVPVKNAMAHPESNQVLPPTEIFPPGMIDTVIPSIPDLKDPTEIRIFLVGQIQDTNEKVGAYMDMTLLP